MYEVDGWEKFVLQPLIALEGKGRTSLSEPSSPIAGERSDFDMRLDADEGIVSIVAYGFWTPTMADRYFAQLARTLDHARRRFGIGRVLVDKRGVPVQSAEVTERIRVGCLEVYTQQDRLAIVVSSNLQKMQVRRSTPSNCTEAFLSILAAKDWLLASKCR